MELRCVGLIDFLSVNPTISPMQKSLQEEQLGVTPHGKCTDCKLNLELCVQDLKYARLALSPRFNSQMRLHVSPGGGEK